MAKALLQELRSTTKVARETEPERLKRQKEAETRRRRQEAGWRTAGAQEYAREHFEDTVDDLIRKMGQCAQRGEGSVCEEWTVRDESYGAPDDQELANNKALRNKVAKHFTELGFEIAKVDHPAMTEDHNIPLSDGYSPQCPPMKRIGEIVGLEITWDQSTTK